MCISFLNVSILEIIIILALTCIKNIFRLLVVVMVLLLTEGGGEIYVDPEADGDNVTKISCRRKAINSICIFNK